MGKTKNRDIKENKKDARLSLRMNSTLLDELKQKSKINNNSKAINEAIKKYLDEKRNPNTDYKCDKCKKTIKKEEKYFCNNDHLEMRFDDEIIVVKAEVVQILCMKCANKDKEIKEFIESEDDFEDTIVQEFTKIG